MDSESSSMKLKDSADHQQSFSSVKNRQSVWNVWGSQQMQCLWGMHTVADTLLSMASGGPDSQGLAGSGKQAGERCRIDRFGSRQNGHRLPAVQASMLAREQRESRCSRLTGRDISLAEMSLKPFLLVSIVWHAIVILVCFQCSRMCCALIKNFKSKLHHVKSKYESLHLPLLAACMYATSAKAFTHG